jgi:hypothetical protein
MKTLNEGQDARREISASNGKKIYLRVSSEHDEAFRDCDLGEWNAEIENGLNPENGSATTCSDSFWFSERIDQH